MVCNLLPRDAMHPGLHTVIRRSASGHVNLLTTSRCWRRQEGAVGSKEDLAARWPSAAKLAHTHGQIGFPNHARLGTFIAAYADDKVCPFALAGEGLPLGLSVVVREREHP